MIDKVPAIAWYEPNVGGLHFPLFKFMEHKYAKSLMDFGSVHLPSMNGFKNTTKHKGRIADKTEGEIFIENEYTQYVGRSRDAEGLISLEHESYNIVAAKNLTLKRHMRMPDALVYCAASNFFSDTLIWAIEDGKDACVMIVDSESFFSSVHLKIQDRYNLLGVQSCNYIKNENGELLEKYPDISSETSFLINDPLRVFFAKPKIYEAQREVRAVFLLKGDLKNIDLRKELEAELVLVPSVTGSLMEIIFKNSDPKILLNEKPGVIFMKVNKKLGISTTFSINEPRGVFSPVFFEGINNELMMGFCYPDVNTFVGAAPSNCDVGVDSFGGTAVFACNAVANIKNIEIYTE